MMLRIPLVLSLCACAVIATYTPGQNPPARETTSVEAAASLKALSEITKERIPELLQSYGKIHELFRDADKREQFKLVHRSLYRGVVEVKTQIYIVDAIENPSDKANVTFMFAQLWSQRLKEFPTQCELLNGLRLLGTASDTVDDDPLNDFINELRKVRDEITPHVEKLKGIKAKQPAIARELLIQ